jgi:hypothetical protein
VSAVAETNDDSPEPSSDVEAPLEPDAPAPAPPKQAVSRTPLRPAGSIREAPREVLKGLILGLLLFGAGARVVQWAFVRWLTRGGSSTVLAVTVLLPVALPLIVGASIGERGRKPLGYAMIAGVIIGLMIVSGWAVTMFPFGGGAPQGIGGLPLMPR